ncbi:MAG: hypothetical protein ACXABJ_06550 [Candidatus Heimdallarchaeaceae archaeon]|jgi:hypothetical protein
MKNINLKEEILNNDKFKEIYDQVPEEEKSMVDSVISAKLPVLQNICDSIYKLAEELQNNPEKAAEFNKQVANFMSNRGNHG